MREERLPLFSLSSSLFALHRRQRSKGCITGRDAPFFGAVPISRTSDDENALIFNVFISSRTPIRPTGRRNDVIELPESHHMSLR